MDICFQTFAVLFLLFSAASCAPAPCPQDAWARVRKSSLELHRIAKSLSLMARSGSKDIYKAQTGPAWIEAEDQCNPEALQKKSETCLSKILGVSLNYSHALRTLSHFESCAAFANRLMPAIRTLQEDMGRTCVTLDAQPGAGSYGTDERWEEQPLCLYTLERLYSFSILTARVFAAGNPAHHTAGLAHRCAL